MSDDAIERILAQYKNNFMEPDHVALKLAVQKIRQYIDKEIRGAFDVAWITSGADTKNLKLAKEIYIKKLRELME